MKKLATVFTLLIIANMVFSQQHEISGSVLVFNKYPVKNLKVSAKKAKTETVTDANGEFKLNVKDKDVLSIEGKTFEKYSKRIDASDTAFTINLIYIDKKKNKDLAISGGFIEREHLEYGLTYLMEENNPFLSFNNVFDAIIYAIPAATLIYENGQTKVQLRGNKSFNGSSAALVVLNGFLTDDISHVNPHSLVSIKVLSPTVATLYGEGSANGVIEIKTKY
jgi:hypothetical protein